MHLLQFLEAALATLTRLINQLRQQVISLKLAQKQTKRETNFS